MLNCEVLMDLSYASILLSNLFLFGISQLGAGFSSLDAFPYNSAIIFLFLCEILPFPRHHLEPFTLQACDLPSRDGR